MLLLMLLPTVVLGLEQALLTSAPVEGERVPIASLTKMMTALVASEQLCDEVLTITNADFDTIKHTKSKLKLGVSLTRCELITLALVASENRAAFALGRSYPGGLTAFVAEMNRRAGVLEMKATFTDPAGLGATNKASMRAIYLLGEEFTKHENLRMLSVTPKVKLAGYNWVSTNNSIRTGGKPIAQKTGFTNEAGSCLYMKIDIGSVIILGAKNRWLQLKQLLAQPKE